MKLLTLQEASDLSRVPVVTLRRRAAKGEIRATKPAGSWLIYADALDEWLRSYEPRTEAGVLQPKPASVTVAAGPASAAPKLRALGGRSS